MNPYLPALVALFLIIFLYSFGEWLRYSGNKNYNATDKKNKRLAKIKKMKSHRKV